MLVGPFSHGPTDDAAQVVQWVGGWPIARANGFDSVHGPFFRRRCSGASGRALATLFWARVHGAAPCARPAASVGVAGLRPGGVRRRMCRALLLEAGRVCRVVGGSVGCCALFDLVGRGSIRTESVQLDASAVRCYLKPIVFVGRGWV